MKTRRRPVGLSVLLGLLGFLGALPAAHAQAPPEIRGSATGPGAAEPAEAEGAGAPAATAGAAFPALRYSGEGSVRASLPLPASTAGHQEEEEVSPRGVFLRSLVIPGWGHAVAGSYTRGGFYFLAQASSGWMLYKSVSTRASARRHRAMHLSLARSRVRAAGVQDPDSVAILALEDERYQEFDELVESRSDQVEDWAALSIFLVLMGAADAFVSAHLEDFPEPLSVRVLPFIGAPAASPAGRGGPAGPDFPWRMGVGLSVRWGGGGSLP